MPFVSSTKRYAVVVVGGGTRRGERRRGEERRGEVDERNRVVRRTELNRSREEKRTRPSTDWRYESKHTRKHRHTITRT